MHCSLQPPLASQANIDHKLTAFDGEPIFNDQAILQSLAPYGKTGRYPHSQRCQPCPTAIRLYQ
ncbi:hypothetical protein NT01EI_3760 [Edwardsiella ictaluri 93-146]|uniref:Uncharacterized protein n=1 Tax=Edwardsiella ictaluri (strain 93-146) TaxID=634503 RepID=C5BB45_EDWI9|nr:hypothetical protein NT01EI_3760 [Edwardsiella ictaluri 93-146]